MKRNLEICRKCSEFLYDNKTGCICGLLFPLLSFGAVSISKRPCDENEWNQKNVPSNCELYAEYFIKDCNE